MKKGLRERMFDGSEISRGSFQGGGKHRTKGLQYGEDVSQRREGAGKRRNKDIGLMFQKIGWG